MPTDFRNTVDICGIDPPFPYLRYEKPEKVAGFQYNGASNGSSRAWDSYLTLLLVFAVS